MIAILAVVVVVGGVLAGYEIHHLQNQVNGLNDAVASLYQQYLKLASK